MDKNKCCMSFSPESTCTGIDCVCKCHETFCEGCREQFERAILSFKGFITNCIFIGCSNYDRKGNRCLDRFIQFYLKIHPYHVAGIDDEVLK